MALAQRKIEATEARLAEVTLPEGGAAWAREAREDALARLRAAGLPDRRDEYWRFTRPDALTAPEPAPAAIVDDAEGALFAERDRLEIVFVDGVFDAEASDSLEATGLTVERLSEALSADIHWAKDLYGTLETRGQNPVSRPMAIWNTALASDGVVIRATGAVAKPVSVVYRRKSEASDAVLHHCIKVEPGASLTLLEQGAGASRMNLVTEVEVGDGGAFHHVRSQGRDHGRKVASASFSRLGKDSVYKSFTLSVNGQLTRNENVIELTGDDAVAHVAGACVGDGDFHHDDTVFVTHDALNCESRQVFKKVLRNGATGVFQGKILVKDGAQKTDGYQISQGLLLDEDSQFLAKPELEIYADDVACSHGSTCGAIDDTALFYLRSRGIELPEAQDLMVLAFLAEALQEIEEQNLADELVDRLRGWLLRHRG